MTGIIILFNFSFDSKTLYLTEKKTILMTWFSYKNGFISSSINIIIKNWFLFSSQNGVICNDR